MPNYHDGYLNQGAPIGALNYDLTLIADNTAVDVSSCSLLRLYSDNATASNRTFTLSSPAVAYAELVILFMSATNSCELLSSGNAKLQSSWTPLQYESLSLQWDGTYWVELCRKKQALANLSDFMITSATNNDILYYKTADLAWENAAVSGDLTNSAGAFTIGAAKISLAKMANLAAQRMIIGSAAGTVPVVIDTTASTSASRIAGKSFSVTCTITNASPGVITATSHGTAVGDGVIFMTTGTLPAGLSPSVLYFVSVVTDANTIQVALTWGGVSINTSNAGSGVHTLITSGLAPVAVSLGNADIAAAAAIAYSKLAALTSGNILVGSAGNVATSVAPSGDATISNTGAVALDPSISVVTAVVSLTQSNIQNLSATPIQLIAAPGSGKLIVVDTVEFLHTYSTTVYANGGDVQVLYHGSTVICLADEDVVNGGASANYFYKPNFYDLGVTADPALNAMTALANLGVDLSNATAAFINGNAANIIKVKVRYRVITLMT